jgi:hypothetical protein
MDALVIPEQPHDTSDASALHDLSATPSTGLCWSSKQMMFSGKAHGGTTRVDAEFIVNGGKMGGNGPYTDDKLFRHLGIAQPLSYKAQYFHLTRRQPRRIR